MAATKLTNRKKRARRKTTARAAANGRAAGAATLNDGVTILHRRYYEGRPQRLAGLERARSEAQVARQIHGLRTSAGLSQRQLAERVGTTASVISRLEDADYNGHSLNMLRRIAEALGHRVALSFVPQPGSRSAPQLPR